MAQHDRQRQVDQSASRLSRRRLLAQAGAIPAAGVMAAHLPTMTAAAARQDAATPVVGGSLTWAVDIMTDTLPYGAIGQPPTHVLTYDSLIMWDSNLVAGPGLAESWEAVDDVTYVYKLRQGVLFHDGKEMTAEDVKYSLDLQKSPPPPGQSFSFYPKIASVDVVDQYTV